MANILFAASQAASGNGGKQEFAVPLMASWNR